MFGFWWWKWLCVCGWTATLENKKTLYASDNAYLEELTKRYIENQSIERNSSERISVDQTSIEAKSSTESVLPLNSDIKQNIHSELNPTVQSIKKPRKGLIVLGVLLVVIASGAFVIPINDMGLSTADVSQFCKSPMGIIGQGFVGETAVNSCSIINSLTNAAIVSGVIGLIFIVIGFVKKKDHNTKLDIIIFAVTLSIVSFIGFQIIMPFPYGFAISIIVPIIIAIISKKKISRIST